MENRRDLCLRRSVAILAMLLPLLVALPVQVWGHGFAGKRLFPQTMLFDDPAPLDELNLFVNRVKGTGVRTTEYSLDFAKRISPWWSVGFTQDLDQLTFDTTSTSGFQNINPKTKGTFFVSEDHETLISWGFEWEIGGTGSPAVGAMSHSTVMVPELFFGKGFGDLPPSLPWLKPLAVTGFVGPTFPLQTSPTNTVPIGFTVQYSFQYLNSFVRDLEFQGLSRTVVRGLVPIVEGIFTPTLNVPGETTGLINVGTFWFAPHPFAGKGYSIGQFGIEASIPVNDLSGQSVGLFVMWGTYLDDLFPESLGAPLFGDLFNTTTKATYGKPIFGR